ncbi:hypothetical protein LI031_28455 [Enterocloster citroniae]|uniref:hypothetical protein n=1 Tax=Enterocloster citroniae TaxID=358743 RepID=UPI001D0976DC|nr:hypothetical protein [Enterocloster citroniae]MCB7067787.1 hypothetical protein [Enterocloster citroniae]
MDFVEKITDEELTYICTIITGKRIKLFFQRNSKEFNKIRPGYRPNGISDDDAIKLVVRFKSKPFIRSFINGYIRGWLDETNDHKAKLIKEGMEPATALLLTLPETQFSDNLKLYFKISEEYYSTEYIQLAISAVQLIQANREVAASNIEEPSKNETYIILQEQFSASKKKWEDTEKGYVQKIETLTIKAEETEKALDVAQKELVCMKAEAVALEADLAELHKLEKSSISCGEMVRDEAYQYTSLCKVVPGHDGRARLIRLSDIENGVILGHYLPDAPEYNKLYTKYTPAGEGYIGIWDWTVTPNITNPERDFIESAYNDKYTPIEVIILRDCTTLDEVINQMKDGIIGKIATGKVIYAYWNDNGTYEGLFCTSKNLDVLENKTRLKANVFSLPMFVFTETDIFSVNERYIHRVINIGMPRKIVRIKDPLEIVKNILMQRVTWTVSKQKGLLKSEYQQFRSFLKELPTDELYSEISDACDCSVKESEEYVKMFIQRADSYLNATDLESEIISSIVQNHPEFEGICKAAVADEWMSENAAQIVQANAELELAQRKVTKQKEILGQITKEYVEKKGELEGLLSAIEQQKQLATDVEMKVAERIEYARKNAADFITDFAFYQTIAAGTVAISQTNASADVFTEGKLLPTEELEPENNWHEQQSTLMYELAEAGVSERFASGLAAYIYAAYVNNIPLLLAGPGAREIADAFSAALFGRLAGTLRLDDDCQISAIEQSLSCEAQVIAIENPFCHSWNRYLPRILSDKSRFYIAVNLYAEDLLIEPNGILNYMVPLLTEFFVDKIPGRDFVGGYMSKKFVHYTPMKINLRHDKLLNAIKVGPFAKKIIQQVLTDMHEIAQDNNADYDCIFALIPYAYACEKTSILKEELLGHPQREIAVSSDVISLINTYFGELNESI